MSKFQKRYFYLLGLLLVVFTSVGCSGGGGNGQAPSTEASPPVTTTPSDLATSTQAQETKLATKFAFPFIPQKEFVLPTEEDFAVNPAVGIETSKRFILVALKEGATEEQFKDVISVSDCQLLGTVPSAGIFQLDCGTTTFEQYNAVVDRLRAHAAVLAASRDQKLSPLVAPQPSPTDPAVEGYVPDFTWDWPPSGSNWGVKMIGAPQAWNANNHIKKREADSNTANAATRKMPVSVVVLDIGFHYGHPDLGGILGKAGWASKAYLAGRECKNHGTSVAGIIGAKPDNGAYVVGVSPFVEMYGIQVADFTSTVAELDQLWQKLPPAPRVVNLSIGNNRYNACYSKAGYPEGRRCDPRSTGRIVDGDACVPSVAQAEIANNGRIFDQFVQSQNTSAGETLFVVGAGNNSKDRYKGGTGDWCHDCSTPPDPLDACAPPPNLSDACAKQGLGDFPTEYNGPFTWAAVNGGGRANIIIAEAGVLDATTPDARMKRASYSDINTTRGMGVFAPSHNNWSDAVDANGKPTASYFGGTSAAVPFVTGAAAYLLAVEPSLTNAELRQLLMERPYAQDMNGGASATDTSLNLLSAVAGICDLSRFKNNCPSRTYLADMDDGSPLGFKLYEQDDDGVVGKKYEVDAQGDDKVDLKDFRRLRDNFLLYTSSEFRDLLEIDKGYTDKHQKLDLNDDGVIEDLRVSPLTQEFFPRAGLNFDSLVDDKKTPFLDKQWRDIDVFADAYEKDGSYKKSVQPVPPAMLEKLMKSVDFIVRPLDAMRELGADGIEVTMDGSLAPGDPDPKDVKPFQNIRILSSPTLTKEKEVALTSPYRVGAQVKWGPVCNGSSTGTPYTIQIMERIENKTIILIPGNHPCEPALRICPSDGTLVPGAHFVVKFSAPACAVDCSGNFFNAPYKGCTSKAKTPEPAPAPETETRKLTHIVHYKVTNFNGSKIARITENTQRPSSSSGYQYENTKKVTLFDSDGNGQTGTTTNYTDQSLSPGNREDVGCSNLSDTPQMYSIGGDKYEWTYQSAKYEYYCEDCVSAPGGFVDYYCDEYRPRPSHPDDVTFRLRNRDPEIDKALNPSLYPSTP